MPEQAGHVAISLPRESFDLNVEFEIPAKGVLGVFGPSGCGKTSLLRCIAGLETSAHGKVQVNGDVWQNSDENISVPAYRRRVGYVFQDGRLFPHLNVRQNLAYGENRCVGAGKITFEQVLDLLELESFLNRKPSALSGGEQQRVAIGRALLRQPQLILMDEPLANLDAERRQELLPFFDRIHNESKVPIIFVSHSIDEVSRLCDRLLILDQGTVAAFGELEEVLANSRLLILRDELGTVMHGTVSDRLEPFGFTKVNSTVGDLILPGNYSKGAKLRLRILARDVSINIEKSESSSILNILPAEITAIDELNERNILVQLAVGVGNLTASISRLSSERLKLKIGDKVFAQIKGLAVRPPLG